jgi:4-amino-4-deoxy-L-arabinose transferase-like glycosyltransferase
MAAAAVLGSILLLLLGRSGGRSGKFAFARPSAVALSIAAISLTPAAWTLAALDTVGNMNSPSARPPGIARNNADGFRQRGFGGRADPKLLAFLAIHADEKFLVATLSAQQAAPLILATGKPVMAIGGFSGADPILTPEKLSQMAQNKEVRFVLIGGGGTGGFAGRGAADQTPLIDWVTQNAHVVDPALWRSLPPEDAPDANNNRRGQRNRGGLNAANQLYDLRPDDASADHSANVPASTAAAN